MAKYLTPTQFKRYGMGVSLDGANIFSLNMAIAQAEGAIDAEMEFDPKIGGFEPHSVWIQGPWHPETLRDEFPSYPIPVRNIQRYRIQVSNLSTTGAGFFANINAADVVINEFDGYFEIVPLQAITYSLSPVILQLGLNPPITQIDCEVGYYLPFLGEILISGGGNNTVYYAQRGFWASSYDQALHVQPNTLPPVPPVVYKNGTVVSSSNYTVDYTEGAITFTGDFTTSTGMANTDVIKADYTATIPDYVVYSCVAQTTWNMAQRQLNAQGFLGVDSIHNGEVSIRKENTSRGAGAVTLSGVKSALCADARGWLSHTKEIGIA